MATFPLRPSFQFNERLAVYADDVTGLDMISPPIPPSTAKSDIFDLEKFLDIDHRATMVNIPFNIIIDSVAEMRKKYFYVPRQAGLEQWEQNKTN